MNSPPHSKTVNAFSVEPGYHLKRLFRNTSQESVNHGLIRSFITSPFYCLLFVGSRRDVVAAQKKCVAANEGAIVQRTAE